MGLALMELCVHRVESVHVCLKSCALFWCKLWFKVFLVVIFEEHREHVFGCLSFGVAHHMDGGIHRLCQQLIGQSVALVETTDYATSLPEANLIQELMTPDSILAYEQFIEVAGG